MNIHAANWTSFFSGGVHHAHELDSTQHFINALPASEAPVFCRADQQRSGKGQRGRAWQSPLGNLYCSMRVYLKQPPASQSGLAQSVALTLAEALDPDPRELTLKWPNDLFTQRGKCGGILIDNRAYQGATLATIGIGLNLTQAQPNRGALARDLDPAYNTPEATLATIMPPLIAALQAWSHRPYLTISHRWSAYDRHHRQTVNLDGHPHPAQVLGIDQKGRLIARDKDGLHFLTQCRIKADA